MRGMPLNRLVLKGTKLSDFSALREFPLVEADLDLPPGGDLPMLLAIPTLKKLNGRPIEEYRRAMAPK